MNELVNIENSSLIQIFIYLFLIVVISVIIGRIYLKQTKESKLENEKIENIENILSEGNILAKQFKKQIIDKREIIKDLNEKLDLKISDLKLLVIKIENFEKNGITCKNEIKKGCGSYEFEKEVIIMAKNNMDTDKIAKQLNMSRNEVEMIISLKTKMGNSVKIEKEKTI